MTRPQNRGLDLVAGGKFTKLRPEKVAHGRKIAAALLAGKPIPPATDRVLELLTHALERADAVGEQDFYAATAHGTTAGKRRPLTKRMQEMLQMYAQGMEAKEIASATGTSVANVHNRMGGACFCLDAINLTEAVAIAVAAGLVVAKPLPAYETTGRKPVLNATPAKTRQRGELSERERAVITLVADGFSDQEIADQLGLAFDTVRSHIKHALSKLDARNRTHAAGLAFRQGLIT